MSTNCLAVNYKEDSNDMALPELGGIAFKLNPTNSPTRLTIQPGRDRPTSQRLEVTIRIEGDGNFVNQAGTSSLGKEITLPDGSDHHWYVATGEAYLHILPISNLGLTFNISNQNDAYFNLDNLKLYEKENNNFPINIIKSGNTKVYGDLVNLPNHDGIQKLSASKYITGNVAELGNAFYELSGVDGQVPSFEYKGSRKGSGVKMIICNQIELGDDFDTYIKDCADCDYQASDFSTIIVYGTTDYDSDTDVQDAVAAVLAKGISKIYIVDSYGNMRQLGV